MTVQRKRGRPSDYCAEIPMTICDRLTAGESLRAICADAGMPDKATDAGMPDKGDRFPLDRPPPTTLCGGETEGCGINSTGA
jgi:hypothetical protein